MHTVTIFRHIQDDTQTFGTCTVALGKQPLFASLCLERGWRNNENSISCIPKGTYDLVLEYSPAFKQDLWEIKGVPGRSEAKFHWANYWYELKGCPALGRRPKFLNSDKYLDLTDSRNTIADFMASLKGQTKAKLIVTGYPDLK